MKTLVVTIATLMMLAATPTLAMSCGGGKSNWSVPLAIL